MLPSRARGMLATARDLGVDGDLVERSRDVALECQWSVE
jgi:hypothetical protein